MVKTAMTIKREVSSMHGTSGMRVLKIRGGRVNLLLLAQERNIGVLLHKGFRHRTTTIKAKAKVYHPKVGDILRRLASQCMEHVSITTSLNT